MSHGTVRRRSAAMGITTITVAVTALAVLTGCARDTEAGAGQEGPARELTRGEQGRIEQAEQRLIQRCMQRQGFRYWVSPHVDTDTDRAFTYRFVRDDIAWAREYGYGEQLRQTFLAAKVHDPNLVYRKRLSAAQRERYGAALEGGLNSPLLSVTLPSGGIIRGPNGGCLRSARDALYGDAAAFFHADKIATNLPRVYMPNIMRDPRFTTGLRTWSRCMYEVTGRHYADPDAARASASRTEGLSAARSHAVEVETAVAEATCAHKASLRDTLSRLDRKYGDPVREQYADEIASSNRMKLAALRRADHVADSG